MRRYSAVFNRRAIRLGLPIAAAVAVSAIVLYRYLFTVDERAAERADRLEVVQGWVEQGQREYRKIPMAAVASLADVGAVRKVLDAVDYSNAPPAGAGTREAVLDGAAEFLFYRYVANSPDEYMKWRRERGYTLIDLKTLHDVFLVKDIIQYMTGEPVPEGATSDEVFRESLRLILETEGGRHRAKGIANVSKGLVCVFGEISMLDRERSPIRGEMSWELWRGGMGTGGTTPNWWRSKNDLEDLFKRHKKVAFADLAIVMEYQSGLRVPIALTYMWDPELKSWRLTYFNSHNVESTDVPYCVY